MTAGLVTGRTILRYRGEPVTHEVRFYAWVPGLVAKCECGWQAQLDDGHTAVDLTRLSRQHAGIEDEDP